MPPWLLFHFVSGDAFWTAAVLALLAIAMLSRWRNRWTFPAAWVLLLSVGLAYFLSGTVQPVWLEAAVACGLIAWLTLEGALKPQGRRAWMLRCAAVALIALIALCELPWHLQPTIPIPQERKLYVVGDSISAGIGTAGVSTWPILVQQSHGIEVVDLSLAGATAETALRHLVDKSLGPGLIVVEIGGNDMIGGRDAAGFERSLDALLARLKKESDAVIMLELPVLPGQSDYARAQRSAAARHRIPLLPKRGFAAVLTHPNHTLDGLHLSAHGHQAMADWIWSHIARHGTAPLPKQTP